MAKKLLTVMATAAVLLLLTQGCATPVAKPFVPPVVVDLPLQDPPPGMAVVYLLRSPYDSSSVSVHMQGRNLAVLPPSSYTVVVLQPGQHVLETRVSGPQSDTETVAAPFKITVMAEERRFVNLSGRQSTSSNLSLFFAGGGLPVPVHAQTTTYDTRSWKEVTELDAQGLMSIAKMVLPEPGAL